MRFYNTETEIIVNIYIFDQNNTKWTEDWLVAARYTYDSDKDYFPVDDDCYRSIIQYALDQSRELDNHRIYIEFEAKG